MASIIPGYEYDIFLSYRQKDNKYDGWVREFIDHLKKEIEATFKEDISIYFDENPHDGLLEIHNVDKSLETKLKSVIFIPVISQTYCDPKSFAWQNEFLAFNKMASADAIGKDITMPSGNVCSRIIPIKIHDLDNTDTELLETEMGCRLHAIEFIYSGAGVNRPLKPDDNPDKNLYKTYYRDQINKVANAVKEVLSGLNTDEKKRNPVTYKTGIKRLDIDERPQSIAEVFAPPKRASGKVFITIIAGVIVILAIIFLINRFDDTGRKKSPARTKGENAIAVLPVLNYTGNQELGWIADMIHNDLTGRLQGISNLIVRPRQTTLQFRNSEESVQEIAKKLIVDNLIESSIKGTEDNLQLEIRVIGAFPEERYLYTASFNESFKELTNIYSGVINSILRGIGIKASEQEEKTYSAARKVNPEVRKLCARGLYQLNLLTNESVELGVKYYRDAIAIDPADPEPYIGLAMALGSAGHGAGIFDDALIQSEINALKAIELDPEELNPNLGDAHIVLAQKYFCYNYDFVKGLHHLKRGLQLNPNSPAAHYLNSWYLTLLGKVDAAADEMKKAIEIDPLDPRWPGNMAWVYQWSGRNEEALIYAEKTLTVNPSYPMAFYVRGMVYSKLGRYEEAIETQKTIYNPRSGFAWGLGVAYALAGQRDKALEVAAEIEKRPNRRWFTWGLAEINASLGDNEKAVYWIEEAYRMRHDFIPWIRCNPQYNKLIDDTRIMNIMNQIYVPE